MIRATASGALAAVVAAALLLPACGGSAFHRYFEAGLYERADEVLAAGPASELDDRTLYRAAQVHAHPGTPAYHPRRAAAELRALLRRSPDGDHAPEATRLLALVDRLVELEELARRRRARADSLRTRVEELRAEGDAADEALEKLRSRLDAVVAELERTRLELERLKAIDLETPPSPSPPDTTGSDLPDR